MCNRGRCWLSDCVLDQQPGKLFPEKVLNQEKNHPGDETEWNFLCTFFNTFIWVDPIIAITNRSRSKRKQMQEFVRQSKTNLSYFRDLETAQLGQKRIMEFEKEQFYHFPWMIDTFPEWLILSYLLFLPTLSSRKCYVVIRTNFTMNAYKRSKRWRAF